MSHRTPNRRPLRPVSCLLPLRPACCFCLLLTASVRIVRSHLDVEAIAALLEAIGEYEGAIVVISHDRAFSEAIEASHVGYVANGAITIEERSLRESDWNELDRGVVNVGGADVGGADEPLAVAGSGRAAADEAAAATVAEQAGVQQQSAAPAKAAAPVVET